MEDRSSVWSDASPVNVPLGREVSWLEERPRYWSDVSPVNTPLGREVSWLEYRLSVWSDVHPEKASDGRDVMKYSARLTPVVVLPQYTPALAVESRRTHASSHTGGAMALW